MLRLLCANHEPLIPTEEHHLLLLKHDSLHNQPLLSLAPLSNLLLTEHLPPLVTASHSFTQASLTLLSTACARQEVKLPREAV